jgi:hypothetical protein
MKRLIFLSFLFSLLFLFSCTHSSIITQTLELAGSNRPELEKVLSHYKNDSLKLRAARFLIENMAYHYTITSPVLTAYYQNEQTKLQTMSPPP